MKIKIVFENFKKFLLKKYSKITTVKCVGNKEEDEILNVRHKVVLKPKDLQDESVSTLGMPLSIFNLN